jgi:hypothetical protein
MFEGGKGKGQGIPWFEFLDADGKSLVTSTGAKGNIGCPDSDEEIDVFIEILRKVVVNLKDDDLSNLKKSLIAHRKKKE